MRRFSMLSYVILLTGGAVLLALPGCGDKRQPVSEVEVTTPPSLAETEITDVQLVRLTEVQASELNVKTMPVEMKPVIFSITAPGSVFPAPEHISIISAPVNGRVTAIYAHEGEEVKQGDALLELESFEFADLAADYLESQAEVLYLEQQVERLRLLVEKNISSQSSLDRATADLTRAQARVRASRARLKAIGIDDRQIDRWNVESNDERATLTIYSPIRGTINQHLIDMGQAVNAYDKLMDILNNEKVLIRGYMPPEDAPLLRLEGRVLITRKSNNESTPGSFKMEATVTSINPALDEENRSIVINSIIETVNGWPVIGQSVRLEYEVQTPQPAISIPMSAVQFEGEDAMVFVKRDDRTFEKRVIEIGRIVRDAAIVNTGLTEKDEVAISQVFSLKALGKYEEFAD